MDPQRNGRDQDNRSLDFQSPNPSRRQETLHDPGRPSLADMVPYRPTGPRPIQPYRATTCDDDDSSHGTVIDGPMPGPARPARLPTATRLAAGHWPTHNSNAPNRDQSSLRINEVKLTK
jgi:hypothetical protein